MSRPDISVSATSANVARGTQSSGVARISERIPQAAVLEVSNARDASIIRHESRAPSPDSRSELNRIRSSHSRGCPQLSRISKLRARCR